MQRTSIAFAAAVGVEALRIKVVMRNVILFAAARQLAEINCDHGSLRGYLKRGAHILSGSILDRSSDRMLLGSHRFQRPNCH